MPPRRRADQAEPTPARDLARRCMPWIIVCVILLIWGTGWFKARGQSDVRPGTTRFRAAQHDQQGRAGRGEADAGRRGVRVHLALLHRLRHADRRDHLRLPDGLLAGGLVARLWPDDQGLRLFADHHLGDAGDRHADAALRHRRDARPRLRRRPASSIPSSARCSAGWAWR